MSRTVLTWLLGLCLALTVAGCGSGGVRSGALSAAEETIDQARLDPLTWRTSASIASNRARLLTVLNSGEEARVSHETLYYGVEVLLGGDLASMQALRRLVPATAPIRDVLDLRLAEYTGDQDAAAAAVGRIVGNPGTSPYNRLYHRAQYLLRFKLFESFDDDRVAREVELLERDAGKLREMPVLALSSRIKLALVEAIGQALTALLEERRGKLESALRHAGEASRLAERAIIVGGTYNLLTERSATLFLDRYWLSLDARQLLSLEVRLLLQSDRADLAKSRIERFLRNVTADNASSLLSGSVALPVLSFDWVDQLNGQIAIAEGDYRAAHDAFAKADQAQSRLGASYRSKDRAAALNGRLTSLWLDERYPEGRDLLPAGEQGPYAEGDSDRYALPLGLFKYALQDWGSARTQFLRALTYYRRLYGDKNVQTELARGLLGASMWRERSGPDHAKARELLVESAAYLMEAANAEVLQRGRMESRIVPIILVEFLDALADDHEAGALPGVVAALEAIKPGTIQKAFSEALSRSSIQDAGLNALVRQEQDLGQHIASLQRYFGNAELSDAARAELRGRIEMLQTRRRETQKDISRLYPKFGQTARPALPTAQDIQSALRDDQAMLVYVPTREKIFAWGVGKRESPRLMRLNVSQAALDKQVDELRGTLDLGRMSTSRVMPFDEAGASHLHELLIRPFDGLVRDKRELVLVTAGSLGHLPFAVLLGNAGRSGAMMPAVDGAVKPDRYWLIDQHALSYVPSISAWIFGKRLSGSGKLDHSLIAWGDPSFRYGGDSRAASDLPAQRRIRNTDWRTVSGSDGGARSFSYEQIPALPETRDELMAIANVFAGTSKSTLFLGREATRDSVQRASASGLLGRHKVVAFATHGLKAADLPGVDQPALAMAATAETNRDIKSSLLRLEDVMQLSLNADVVLLSACNTAAADGQVGEAFEGLARGFFYAGSKSLLVTHWSVESESAMLISTGTFRIKTQSPGHNLADALRESMLQLRKERRYQHPAYWAPYVLVGDSL